MDLSFSEEQILFRDAVRGTLQKACPPEVVRASWSSSCPSELWSKLAELGVFGMLVPEAHGGLGMNEVDHVLALEECGRAAVPGPVIETCAIAVPLLRDLKDTTLAKEWLPKIAAGEARVTVGLADAPFVLDADTADLLLFSTGGAWYAFAPGEVRLTPQPSVDGARKLFSVEAPSGSHRRVAKGHEAGTLDEQAFERGGLAVAAQLLGLSRRMLEMTVDYVKVRTQFRKPIGSFQAVKHHLASALLPLELASPVVYRAAWSAAHGHPEHALHASMAKAFASEAAKVVARAALQCHGAIGYSFEHDLHLWMKRAWALSASWGSASFHRMCIGDYIFDDERDTKDLS